MSEELNQLKQQRNQLVNKIINLEFEEKGYKEKLEKQKIFYKLFYRTPLHKNHYVVGIPKIDLQKLIKSKGIVVIVLVNSKKCNDYIFYVYDNDKDIHFLSGHTEYTQYINYSCIPIGQEERKYLNTMEEYLKCQNQKQNLSNGIKPDKQ